MTFTYVKEQAKRAAPSESRLDIEDLKERLEVLLEEADKDAMICDAGCRNGQGLLVLQEMGFSNIIGIDLVEQNVKACMKNGVSALLGDIHEIDTHFKPETFDYILLSHTLEHLLVPQKGLKALYKVLKPGGTMLIVVPIENHLNPKVGHHLYFPNIETLEALVKPCGFETVSWFHPKGEIWCLAIRKV